MPPQPGQHINSAAAAAAAISSLEGEHRMFLCRMNVSRNARRQMRFGDQKVSDKTVSFSIKAQCFFVSKTQCNNTTVMNYA